MNSSPNNIYAHALASADGGGQNDAPLAMKPEPIVGENTAKQTPDRKVAELTPEQYGQRLAALRNAQVNGGQDFYNSPENRVAFYTSALGVLGVSTDIDGVNPSIQTQERILGPRFAKIDTALLRGNPDIATCIRPENNLYKWALIQKGGDFLASRLGNVLYEKGNPGPVRLSS